MWVGGSGDVPIHGRVLGTRAKVAGGLVTRPVALYVQSRGVETFTPITDAQIVGIEVLKSTFVGHYPLLLHGAWRAESLLRTIAPLESVGVSLAGTVLVVSSAA